MLTHLWLNFNICFTKPTITCVIIKFINNKDKIITEFLLVYGLSHKLTIILRYYVNIRIWTEKTLELDQRIKKSQRT